MGTLSQFSPAAGRPPASDRSPDEQDEPNEFSAAKAAWESERAKLVAERDQAQQLLRDTEEAAALALERQVVSAVDKVRAELAVKTEEAENLRQEIRNLASELDSTKLLLTGTEEAAAIALQRQITTATDQVRDEMAARLELQQQEHQRALTEAEKTASGRIQSELSKVAVAQQEVSDAAERARLEWNAESARLSQDLLHATQQSSQLNAERIQLATERDQALQLFAEAREAKHAAQLESERIATDFKTEEARFQGALQEAIQQSELLRAECTQLVAEHQRTLQALTAAKDAHGSLLAESEKFAAEFQREAARFQQELQETTQQTAKLNAERAQLLAERDQALQSLAEAREAHGMALSDRERSAAEFTGENARLEQQLQQALQQTTQWSEERRQLVAERDQALQSLAEAREAHGVALSEGEKFSAEFKSEGARLQQELQQALGQAAQLSEERMQIAAERDQALLALADAKEAQRAALLESERSAEAFSGEGSRLRQELAEMLHRSEQWTAERTQLVSERDQALQSCADAKEAQQAALIQSQQAGAEMLERETVAAVEQIRKHSEEERQKMAEELEQFKARLTKSETTSVQATLAFQAAEQRNSELLADRDRLRRELQQVADAKLSVQGSAAPENAVQSTLASEQSRVEALMKELAELIDDPSTELSLIMRKNAERTQLEHYLKGLQFLASGK